MASVEKSCTIPAIILFVLVLSLTSCTRLLTGTIVQPTVDNLQKQTDLDLVCEGAPAYLLMIDSMIATSPQNRALLRIGAQSYGSYTAALSECGAARDRLLAIADKARMHGNNLIAAMPMPESAILTSACPSSRIAAIVIWPPDSMNSLMLRRLASGSRAVLLITPPLPEREGIPDAHSTAGVLPPG